MEQLTKEVSAENITRNNRRDIFVRSMSRHYKEGQRRSLKSVEFRDASLPGYELGSRGTEMRIEASELSAVQRS
jgi:hypothetical protein